VSWDFAIELDRTRDRSLSRQIAQAIAADIYRSRLRPGDRLPGSRTLAGMLNVHRQTVTTAIDDLIAEGWLISRRTRESSLPTVCRTCRAVAGSATVEPDGLQRRGSRSTSRARPVPNCLPLSKPGRF
jgi:DNA-binding transcriptional regulator YhcF (GntR family)